MYIGNYLEKDLIEEMFDYRLESAISNLNEINHIFEESEETSKNIIAKIKSTIDNSRDAIQKIIKNNKIFIKDSIDSINAEIKSQKIKSNLNSFKKELSIINSNSNLLNNKNFKTFDAKKFNKDFDNYVKEYTAGTIKIIKKEYDDPWNECEKAFDELDKSLAMKYKDLSDTEKYIITQTANDFINWVDESSVSVASTLRAEADDVNDNMDKIISELDVHMAKYVSKLKGTDEFKAKLRVAQKSSASLASSLRQKRVISQKILRMINSGMYDIKKLLSKNKTFKENTKEGYIMFIALESALDRKISNAEDRFNAALFFENSDDDNSKNDAEKKESKMKALIEKVAQFIKSIADAIKKFFEDMNQAFDTKVQQMRVQQRLKVYKKLWATEAVREANRGKVKYFDVLKLQSEYKKFINKFIKEHKRILNKDYKTYSEFVDDINKTNLNMDKEFDYLTDAERYTISVSINQVIELTEKELEQSDKITKLFMDEFNNACAELFNEFKSTDNTKEEENVINAKAQEVNTFASKMSSKIKTLSSTVRSAIMQAISMLNSVFSKFIKVKDNGDVEVKDDVVQESVQKTRFLNDVIADKKYNLVVEHAEHEFKMSADILEIMMMESEDDSNDDEKKEEKLEQTKKTLIERVREFIDKILKALKDSFETISEKVKSLFKEKDANKIITEIEEQTKDPDFVKKLKTKNVEFIDMDSYINDYESSMDEFEREVVSILNKKYTKIEELERDIAKSDEMCRDIQDMISHNKKHLIEKKGDAFVTWAKSRTDGFNKKYSQEYKDTIDKIDNVKKTFENTDDESFEILQAKSRFSTKATSQISMLSKHMMNGGMYKAHRFMLGTLLTILAIGTLGGGSVHIDNTSN